MNPDRAPDRKYAKFTLPHLPIDECLDDLLETLRSRNSAVLVAPPGAGKTSRVPLLLADEPWARGRRILVLEPRRLAARAAAEHMASLIGEKPGGLIGYRVRMDSAVGPDTRIEFITEGIFTRMILDDPELTDIACVCFDEFHERNLEGDLGLALALDVQASLRDDLRLLPMSATLDGAQVAVLLGNAPAIESRGRSFAVDIRYQPRRPDSRLEDDMAFAIRKTLKETDGSLLCFLPGQGEILRTIERLDGLPDNTDVYGLFGAMKPLDQRAAILPAPTGRRKIVLATSIAQTSLTLDGVSVVIDSGLARVSRHEPATGLNRLETIRASKAAIAQRSGRAGRTREGICIRLWHEGQTASLPDQEKPEILDAELGNLVLDLADWGISDPGLLCWLDQPPKPAWEIACETLRAIDALDDENRITPTGKALRSMPFPPRLAHMVLKAGQTGMAAMAEQAARLALLVTERGAGGRDTDLAIRLENLSAKNDPVSRKVMASARSIAKNMTMPIGGKTVALAQELSPGAMLSLAWPERIGRRMGPIGSRSGREGEVQYLLANGRRAIIDGLSPLAKEDWLAVCEIQGSAASARILSAAPLSRAEIEALHDKSITIAREVSLDETSGVFKAQTISRLGNIVLSNKPVALKAGDDVPEKIIGHFQSTGLPKGLQEGEAAALRGRLTFLHCRFPDRFKPVDDGALIDEIDEWLLPLLSGATSLADVTPTLLCEGLKLHAGYQNLTDMDRLAPRKFPLPSGQSHRLEYSADAVTLRARVQEFFGLTTHPTIGENTVPLVLELLSPAMRPIQKTLDIKGFWEGSWQDVRKEMRGRYPKHFWPENPAVEKATTRAKPRN